MAVPPIPPTLPDESLFTAPPSDNLGASRTCTELDDFGQFVAGPNMIQRGETIFVAPKPNGGVYSAANDTGFFGMLLTTPGWSCFRPTPAAEANIAPPGVRINPTAHAPFMPRFQQGKKSQGGPFYVLSGTQGLRFIGLHVKAYINQTDDPLGARNLECWRFGFTGGTGADSSRIQIDRCMVMGQEKKDHMAAAIVLGSCFDVRVTNSHIDNWQSSFGDNPGIKIARSQGRILVENNYASNSLIFIGGSGSMFTEAQMPKHVIIRRNTCEIKEFTMGNTNQAGFVKGNAPGFLPPPPFLSNDGPVAAGHWNVKAGLEIKAAQYILIEANTLINQWQWPALTIDSWEQDDSGSEPFNRIEDLTARYNYVPPGSDGFGTNTFTQLYCGNKPIRRVHIHDNLSWAYRYRYATTTLGYQQGQGMAFYPGAYKANGAPREPRTRDQLVDALTDIHFEHNTFVCNRNGFIITGQTIIPGLSKRFRIANNIIGYGNEGWETEQQWTKFDDAWMESIIQDHEFKNIAFVDWGNTENGGNRARAYSQSLWGPSSGVAAGQALIVGNPATAGIDATMNSGTGRLLTGSTMKAGGIHQADDGLDNGVRFDLLESALGGQILTPAPTANFTTAQLPGTFTIAFTDTSLNTPTSWNWDFGDQP